MKFGKMIVRIAASFLFFSFSMMCFSQQPVANPYPQDFFRNPLGVPYSLSANYGELRTNHWHMGLDLRTQQRENLPVYAAAGGHVASIGIRPLSFGRFMVIDHPNGYSTLYAHLNKFYPELEAEVSRLQREKESWAIELKFKENEFRVKKGQLIAYSGNTGGSGGPHLHWEIRETATTRCLNPLLFGLNVPDQRPPVISKLAIYDRRVSSYGQNPIMIALKKSGSGYTTVPSLINSSSPRVSLAMIATDRTNVSFSNEGIFASRLFVDDELIYHFRADDMDYDHSRYINAYIDYKYKAERGASLQHLSRLPGNQAPLYPVLKNDGVIELQDNQVHKIRLQVLDAHDNVSELSFSIRYQPGFKEPSARRGRLLIPGEVNIIEEDEAEFFLTEENLYDTILFAYQRMPGSIPGIASAIHRLNDAVIPVHGEFKVRIRANRELSAHEKSRTLMVREWKGRKYPRRVEWQNNWATASFGDFGNFYLVTDLEGPQVNAPIPGRDTLLMRSQTRIVFTPADPSGIRVFHAELNGEWLKFTNDKGRNWIYQVDGQMPYGTHHLKLRLEDLAGNTTIKEWWIRRERYVPRKTSTYKRRKRG